MKFNQWKSQFSLFLTGYPRLRHAIKLTLGLYSYVPYTEAFAKRSFLKNKYMAHIRGESEYIFASITRFCVANRPINGYYFEFGCHTGGTMRLAFDYFHHLFDWKYVAFDSFEGLPEIQAIDKQEIWQKGKLATHEGDFVKILTKHGMPRNQLITIKGFYDQSLTNSIRAQLSPGKAAVIYIDCDLYVSTVPVLEFVRHFFQRGTIIVFDDWNCFWGDPTKGERRAFAEFRAKYPELIFEEFIATHMQKAFIFIRNENE